MTSAGACTRSTYVIGLRSAHISGSSSGLPPYNARSYALELRHAGVVGGHQVARRDPGEHRLPSLGMQPGVETREASTPRPPGERDAIGVGDARPRSARRGTAITSSVSGNHGLPTSACTERDAVAGRSSVVRDRDRVARVDERVGLGIEPASLVPLRPTVHAHDGGPRAVALRRRHERLDPLTVRVRRTRDGTARSPGGYRVAGRGDHGPSVVRDDRRHPRDCRCSGTTPHRPGGPLPRGSRPWPPRRASPCATPDRSSRADPCLRTRDEPGWMSRRATTPPGSRLRGDRSPDHAALRSRDPRSPVVRTRRASDVKSNRWSPGSGLHATGSRFDPVVDLLADGLALRHPPRAALHGRCRRAPRVGGTSSARRPRALPLPPARAGRRPIGCAIRPDEPGRAVGGDEVRAVVVLRAEPERDLARPRERDPLSPARRGDLRPSGPSPGPVERAPPPSRPVSSPTSSCHQTTRPSGATRCFFHPDRLVR